MLSIYLVLECAIIHDCYSDQAVYTQSMEISAKCFVFLSRNQIDVMKIFIQSNRVTYNLKGSRYNVVPGKELRGYPIYMVEPDMQIDTECSIHCEKQVVLMLFYLIIKV